MTLNWSRRGRRRTVASFAHLCTRSILPILLASVFALPASASDPGCPPAGGPLSEPGQPRNLGGLKTELVYYKCSGAYDRDFSQVIDQAISYLLKRAKGGGKLALVLDIDETALSNWEKLVADDFGFFLDGSCTLLPRGPCGENEWELLARSAPTDTLRLFKVARANNVAVFFVTGRQKTSSIKEATEKNLHQAGYWDWADLFLKPNDGRSVEQFKTQAREEIEQRGYTIIANVGDQYSDLRGKHTEQVFKLPNPFYFIP